MDWEGGRRQFLLGPSKLWILLLTCSSVAFWVTKGWWVLCHKMAPSLFPVLFHSDKTEQRPRGQHRWSMSHLTTLMGDERREGMGGVNLTIDTRNAEAKNVVTVLHPTDLHWSMCLPHQERQHTENKIARVEASTEGDYSALCVPHTGASKCCSQYFDT